MAATKNPPNAKVPKSLPAKKPVKAAGPLLQGDQCLVFYLGGK